MESKAREKEILGGFRIQRLEDRVLWCCNGKALESKP
jgi:hypothetical protein